MTRTSNLQARLKLNATFLAKLRLKPTSEGCTFWRRSFALLASSEAPPQTDERGGTSWRRSFALLVPGYWLLVFFRPLRRALEEALPRAEVV